MKEFQYTVKDACGIHARPAGLLVKLVKGLRKHRHPLKRAARPATCAS